MLPVFVFAVMACVPLPAAAALSIRVTVHNKTDRVLHFETSRDRHNGKSGHLALEGEKRNFTVPKDGSADAPIQSDSLWVAVKCPIGVAFGLTFYNPAIDTPSVEAVDDNLLQLADTDHYFQTQWVHYFWRQRVRVYRHDDSGNRKVFSETILQAPSCD